MIIKTLILLATILPTNALAQAYNPTEVFQAGMRRGDLLCESIRRGANTLTQTAEFYLENASKNDIEIIKVVLDNEKSQIFDTFYTGFGETAKPCLHQYIQLKR